MKKSKLILVVMLLSLFFCASRNINKHSSFNQEDKDYIISKLNGNIRCLSYNWNKCSKSIIILGFNLNDKGHIEKIDIINESKLCPEIPLHIKHFYKDTANDFKLLKVDRPLSFRFEYNFKECYKNRCLPIPEL